MVLILLKHVRLKNNMTQILSKKLIINSIAIFMTTTILAGCSSLGGSSVSKRASKLSTGIQKAYAVHPDTANRISPYIIQTADQYELDPLLIAAVIRQESTFRPTAVSSAGAVGLTQVMPRYWQATCPGDLYDELTNINCGSLILTKYKNSAGSIPKALAYYNVGPTAYNTNRQMKKQGKKYAKQVEQHQENLKSAL